MFYHSRHSFKGYLTPLLDANKNAKNVMFPLTKESANAKKLECKVKSMKKQLVHNRKSTFC